MSLSLSTIATIKALAEVGLFITQSVIELSAGTKTPEQIKAKWPEVTQKLNDAWDAWDNTKAPD